ncbi:exonuclease SbcCD subunit D [Luedemannella helvata]|uniref:Nuclease SbcCD subunit D n=1 Tax=Luedemannella helvata TaxID=349315 RepID=A0ABN2L522_9ACTN
MKILHTSDWHVGKVLKGQSRADEQVAVLADIVKIAESERPDLVIVAGDLFDTATPAAESKKLVVRALSALRRHADAVVVIAGNHDHAAEIDALRPWADGAGVTLRGSVGPAADHLVTGTTRAGEPWRLAALPFVSQRYAVRASEMFELSAADASATYADHVARLIGALTESFADGTATVNLVTGHLTVVGAKLGGGERDAHTIEAYAVPSTVFPAATHYVALGHLHRRQQVLAPCPTHYCGSPLAVDFGEEDNQPGVNVVEVTARTAAKVRAVPVSAATPLRTVRGTLAELSAMTVPEDAWLRVYVREAPRAGLREDVQQLLPRALEVRIDPLVLPELDPSRTVETRAGRSPRDLFADYLTAKGIADPAVGDLFNRLYDEVSTAGGAH